MKLKGLLVIVLLFVFSASLSLIGMEKKPVDPVNWRKLIKFLTDIPGWKAVGEPEGSSVSMAGFKISQAERSYTAGDSNLKISITDGGYVPMVYVAFKMAMNFEIDTSEEYTKKVNIKGFAGIEQYEYKVNEGKVIILIGERFLVNLEGENVKDTSGLRAIANSLDLEGIAKLAK
ncbi:MAG: hypothetical protein ACETWK_10150 [Candidatus Aminicenantaceae bacterium]